MKQELNTNELKRIATNILVEFDRVCRENEIKYSIAYGTMLGAVRHHGFIPWDDDVDVVMTRDEYNRFLHISDQLNADFEMISLDTNRLFMAPLAKIIDKNTELHQVSHKGEKVTLGVYIDVFVFDKVPTNDKKRKLLYKTVSFLERCWSFCENSSDKPGVVGIIRRYFNKTLAGRHFSKLINHIAQKNRVSDTYSNLMYSVYDRSKEEIDCCDIYDVVTYEFEGKKVLGFRDYDKYLKRLYGDYMKLPPIEQRVTHHNFVAYYKN